VRKIKTFVNSWDGSIMMRFSFETPIKYQDDLDENQDYLFVLGHMLLKNIKYKEYIKNSSKYKILDNSAYELGESINPLILKNLADEIKADVIVVPDKLFDNKRSEELAEEFFLLFKGESKRFMFMKVVTGRDINETIDSLKYIEKDSRVDIIGISRARSVVVPNLSYLMNIYNKNNMKKKIHLLGLTHPFEIYEAAQYPEILSIDTGLPINFSLKNIALPYVQVSTDFKRVSGVDLDEEVEMDIMLAKYNINVLRSYYRSYGIN